MKKIDFLKLFLTICMVLLLIKIPIFHILNVQKPDKRIVETVGIPLNIIATTVKEAPDLLDDELQNYAYSMLDKELYQDYQLGNFNILKWDGANLNYIENSGYYQILKMCLKCFYYSPKTAFKGLFGTTDLVYGLRNSFESDVKTDLVENDYGIEDKGNLKLAIFLELYSAFVNKTFLRYFRTYGVTLLVMIIFVIAHLDIKSRESLKLTFVCSSIFIYDFGTMLLLTAPDSRFFYINFLVCPMIILILLYKRA